MKRILLVAGFALLSMGVHAQVGINAGDGNNTPQNPTLAPDAVLQVANKQGENKGVLLPSVSLRNATDQSTITKSDGVTTVSKGLLVWNDGKSGLAEGYYSWDGNRWVSMGIDLKVKNGLTYEASTTTVGLPDATNGKLLMWSGDGYKPTSLTAGYGLTVNGLDINLADEKNDEIINNVKHRLVKWANVVRNESRKKYTGTSGTWYFKDGGWYYEGLAYVAGRFDKTGPHINNPYLNSNVFNMMYNNIDCDICTPIFSEPLNHIASKIYKTEGNKIDRVNDKNRQQCGMLAKSEASYFETSWKKKPTISLKPVRVIGGALNLGPDEEDLYIVKPVEQLWYYNE